MVILFEAETKKSDPLLRFEAIMCSNWLEMPINGMAVMNFDVSLFPDSVICRKGILKIQVTLVVMTKWCNYLAFMDDWLELSL